MRSELDNEELYWEVYAGYSGVPYPTYSLSISHDRFTLKPKTDNFISFAVEKDTILDKHGVFSSTKYCSLYASYADSIKCYKECLLNHFKEQFP